MSRAEGRKRASSYLPWVPRVNAQERGGREAFWRRLSERRHRLFLGCPTQSPITSPPTVERKAPNPLLFPAPPYVQQYEHTRCPQGKPTRTRGERKRKRKRRRCQRQRTKGETFFVWGRAFPLAQCFFHTRRKSVQSARRWESKVGGGALSLGGATRGAIHRLHVRGTRTFFLSFPAPYVCVQHSRYLASLAPRRLDTRRCTYARPTGKKLSPQKNTEGLLLVLLFLYAIEPV